ncbi:MAG: M36 family metallopeptidase [Ignavibacteria bacterium]|nr:M36 family metallopeptidase [Ignavibacteria bacterium]
MRPTFSICILLVATTLTWAGTSPSGSYTYTRNARIEANTGIPRALYFQNAGPYQGTPEQMARQYLQEKAKTFRLSESLSDLKTIDVQESPMGYHVTFQQTYQDIPVYRSDVVVTVERATSRVVFTVNNYKSSLKLRQVTPKLDSDRAIQLARTHLKVKGKLIGDQSATLMIYAEDPKRPRLSYRVIVPTENPLGDWEVFVDALTGAVFSVNDMAQYANEPSRHQKSGQGILVNGTGYVYDPDPLTTAGVAGGTAGYTDNNDADSPQLDSQRVLVTLNGITQNGATYSLTGPYVQITDFESPTDTFTTPAHPDSFRFHRSQQAFEEVMVYYHIDKTQRYIQSLGFNSIQNLSMQADPHGLNGADNSHYVPSSNRIAFGEGGVDDAEDADVIWHEYGHAIQNGQKPGWGSSGGEARHIGEGFGDYWAGSYSKANWAYGSDNVFNWDGTAPTGALRTLTDPRGYPRNGVAALEVHNAGQIWSSVLMVLWSDLGRAVMDKLVLQSHYLLGANPTMHDNACAIIQADRSLYGGSHINTLFQRFVARGFLRVDIEFVIDDTGSMSEEIGGVRDALTAFLAGFKADTCIVYQLTTFKDDVTQRDLTIDLNVIRNQVAGLYASGGGDCPEASVEALTAVKDTVRNGGVILLATDADPHPGLNLGTTISALRARGIRVNVLLSGSCTESPPVAGPLAPSRIAPSFNSRADMRAGSQDPSKGPDGRIYQHARALSDTLILGDEDYIEVSLPFGFSFCGKTYTSVFVNSNGYITFGGGTIEYYPYPSYLVSGLRRICGLWANLYPPGGGTITARQVGPEFHISYMNVPDYYYSSNTARFTIRLRSDGTFRVDYDTTTVNYGIAGFSAGGSSSSPPPEIDLSTASQPIVAGALGTAYESFDASDVDLSGLSIEYAACTFNPPTGTISGMKFNDANANGVRDISEGGLKGWTITVSGPIYRSTVTDSLGHYNFVDLPMGSYYVSEYSQYLWTQTYPSNGYYYVTVDSGATIDTLDFGNFLGSGIAGTKFYDANNNGVKDFGEVGLQSWKIRITGPRNDSTITSVYGSYAFNALPPGTYTVSEEVLGGWTQTYPLSGSWTVVIDSPGSSITNIDFGNYAPPAEIHGMKFHDRNSNGIKDVNEPGLAGWYIYVSGTSSLYTVTDSLGNYSFTNLAPGVYDMSEGYQSGWYQTVGVGTVTLNPGDVAVNKDFGNYKPPGAIEAFSQLAAETGGFFAYVPEVNGGDTTEARRYKNIAYNIVQGGIAKSIGLTQPPKVPAGATLDVTMTGSNTNFEPGTTVSISGSGVTVSGVTVLSPIELVAEIVVDTGTALGFRDVKAITDLGGGVIDTAIGIQSIQITQAPVTPSILSIAPPAGAVGDSLTVIVSSINTNFTNSSVLDLGAGISVSNVAAVTPTKLSARIRVDTAATIGFRSVTVTTGGEVASEDVPGPFLVTSTSLEIAVIAQVLPGTAYQGDSLTIAITGSNTHFETGTSDVSFSGSGITVLAVRVLSPTQIEADLQIDPLAPLGYRDVFVTTGVEVATALNAFNVASPPVGVEEEKPTPTSYSLRQSYPNPFNPTTTVEFDLPQLAKVTVKIYDVLGREIARIVDGEEYTAGTYRITVDGTNMASGVYFYSMRAQSGSETFTDIKKMILMK